MMAQEQIKHVFNVPETPRVILSNIRGSVDIQTGEDDSILVTAIKHLDTGDDEHTEIFISQRADETVTVKTRYRAKSWFLSLGKHPCNVDYIIRVPLACSLNVSGVSNTAAIDGIGGEAMIDTISGSLALSDLTGGLNISSISGDIKGEALSGSLKLKTVSGDVDFSKSNFGKINGSTVSGDLDIQTQISGAYHFNSISGDICLIVPPDTNCLVKISSVSGEFVTALPSSHGQRRNGKGFCEIGSGGVNLNFDSVSGDLSLTTAGSAPATPQDELGPGSQDFRRNVLDRIDQGELSIQEALHELQG
jgi:hypothetical protein